MDNRIKITPCEYCGYCRFPRSSDDNGGLCKCKLAKYKTIDVYVSGGETPSWCPMIKKRGAKNG